MYYWDGSGNTYRAVLPYDANMVFQFQRQAAEKASIMGNIIRQAANVSKTAGTATYSRLVPQADAEVIRAMQFATTWCYLSFKGNLYKVEFDATVHDKIIGGKIKVNIVFKIISQEI